MTFQGCPYHNEMHLGFDFIAFITDGKFPRIENYNGLVLTIFKIIEFCSKDYNSNINCEYDWTI